MPLAPSSRAAKVLEDKLEVPSFTLHGWLAERERLADAAPHSKRRARGPDAQERYELRPGDVVIVDEAGMAGSQNLARVVEQAEAAGALVRLIGDPYQLGSIECGGLLRQIQRDIGAVELEELHRFADPSEAAATLALRDGDPADAWRWYTEHKRMVGGSREEMLNAVFAAWQADTEAGMETLMMADSADSVRELNARAQAVQLAAGKIGMRRTAALRDDITTGIGDLIVTRKNARRLSVRGQRDHVKNGNQWVVEAIDRRGAVRARHTGHGGRVVLPAGYLRQHTELGYACTVHRAQGLTVQTAHGLVTATTSRESAYVEATRGWASNRLYVVTDGSGQTMHDVLDTVASSSPASVSAHTVIRDEQDRAYGIGQLAAEYNDVHARATSARIQALARSVLGGSAEMFIGAEAWGILERSLRTAEREGWNLTRLIADAFAERDFHDAEDPSAVLAWRIDNRVEEGTLAAERAAERKAEPGGNRPLKTLDGDQLQRLLDLAQQHRHAALDELHRADAAVDSQPRTVVAGGLPYPAWPLRAHGHLTRSQLAEALSRTRIAARRTGPGHDQHTRETAARERARLRREQQLRRSMAPRDRMREDWQREPRSDASHTAHQPVDITVAELNINLYRQDESRERLVRAEFIASTIAAEQRLRRRLPDGPAPVPDHAGPLPDWLAPTDAIRDRDTPEGWRQHLVERRLVLSQRLTEMGSVIAQEQPAWLQPLGPLPAAGKDRREEWERTAALVEAWRIRHGVGEQETGIGEQPIDARDKQAWTILSERIAAVGRRGRATQSALRRPQEPASGMRIAARTAAAIHRRLLETHFADPGDRAEVAAAAASFAALALERSRGGAGPAEQWVEQIPSPPADDEQADQWKHLVAAVHTYRLLNRLDSPAPLGENADSEMPDDRDELHAALTLYQRSRTMQRLDEIRNLRGTRQGNRLPQAIEQPAGRRNPRQHPDQDQREHRYGRHSGRGGQ